MYVTITLSLLILAVVAISVLRFSRPSPSYAWLAAALGGILAWGSIFAWQLDMPRRFAFSLWEPASLFNASPELLVNAHAWVYALALVALTTAVVLTSPARASMSTNPAAWAGSLALTALALLAVLADNPLTLVLVWTAIDLAELFNTLRASDTPELSERAVISFSIRACGTGLALWASVINMIQGQAFLFENIQPQTGIFLLLAAGLRLGVLPLHLAFRGEPTLRRGFGTLLRLTTAATSLILLARLPAANLDAPYIPFLLLFAGLAGLYGAWKWITASDELTGRPYWIIGMSALAVAAALRGSPTGSASWGLAMLLFGGISFLYSARQTWFTRILAALGLLMLGLPGTFSAAGWEGTFRWPWLFWPLFVAAHLLLMGGYVRHLFQPGEAELSELPSWAAAYPVGLGLLVITALVAGLWGWPGALRGLAGVAPLVLLAIIALAGLAIWRFGRSLTPEVLPAAAQAGVSQFASAQGLLAGLLWSLYRTLGRFFIYASNLLEGDGGLLWTLLLLVLLVTTIQGR